MKQYFIDQRSKQELREMARNLGVSKPDKLNSTKLKSTLIAFPYSKLKDSINLKN